VEDLSECRQGVKDICINFTSPLGRGSGTVSWRTPLEVSVAGFNVVTYQSPGGERVQLNDTPIPCQECVTLSGATYTFIVPKHKSGKNIYIELVRQDGTVQTFGPAAKGCGP